MTSNDEESLPSEKMREMENGKIIVQVSNDKTEKEEITPKKIKFPFYHFISEIILLLLSVVSFSLMIVSPYIFFDTINHYGFNYYVLKTWVFILVLPATAIALLNTYFYIFRLDPKHRGKIFIVRFLTIVSFATLPIPLWTPEDYAYDFKGDLILLFILIAYALLSSFILRIYLLTSDKKIRYTLFKKAIAGSPSELEWRKYHTLSGYLAIITGLLGIQFLWLIYHLLIRPNLIKNAKRRLIINSLNFEEEVNLSTVALDLGISLEETIFILKQLQLKRHLSLEFTRYGAKLKEVRKAKWFSLVIQEKYEKYLSKQKMSEYEIKANKFIELTERMRIKLEDFKRIMDFRETFSSDDFILFLPPKVASIRKPIFSSEYYIFLNHNQTLLRREKIISAFKEHGDQMFGKPKPETASKTKVPTSAKK